tara:strand:+ start:6489 stop:7781 length:1293 start_codon:yes stop_codon:yes gene_type:complete
MTNTWMHLKHFVDSMKQTTSSIKKKEIIETYSEVEFVTECLKWTLDPFKMYYVTSKNCKKFSHLGGSINSQSVHNSIFDLLSDLDNRVITGHAAITAVNSFCNDSKEPFVKDLVYSIIDKNLQIRANAKLINKVIPGLIPSFEIALANSYDPKHLDLEDTTWLASRKLDGVRCIAICNSVGNVKLHSRAGKEFDTLDKVKQDLIYAMKPNTVWDGEICILDEKGNESFQGIMKEIRRKDHTIPNPMFLVFDYLTLAEFNTGTSTRTLSERNGLELDMDHVQSLQFDKVIDTKHVQDMADEAEDLGYEGIMVRRDTIYKGKRSNDILKVKKMHDAEYEIMGYDFADHRIIENGKEETQRLLSQIYIEHKGNRVGVGSGFSKAERKYYNINFEELKGKIATIQYFEETLNDEGNYSLRFPVVKHIYSGSRDC